MIGLCVTAGGKTVAHATAAFMLTWTHSVEKTAWQEDWTVLPEGLAIAEARIEGSGAGMEPAEEATFDGKWWRWRPALAVLPALRLARSGATGSGWTLCYGGGCAPLAPETPDDREPVVLTSCEAG